MTTLHVLKSEPDEIIATPMGPSSGGRKVQKFEIYKADVDYDQFF